MRGVSGIAWEDISKRLGFVQQTSAVHVLLPAGKTSKGLCEKEDMPALFKHRREQP